MAGAQPSLTAVTDDASRGGLFVQSNVANPVSGVDVQGEVVNDSTITLSVTINGEVQTQTFTTNQAADSTESFDFTVATGAGGTGDNVIGGEFNANTATLTLRRSIGSDINIGGFVFQDRTDDQVNDLIDARIAVTDIDALRDVPTIGTAGQVLSVNSTANGLVYADPSIALVSANSFSSMDNTVVITQNGAFVDLEARPAWEGNANTAPAGTTTVIATDTVQVERITLAADTGLVLVDNGAGAYTIQAAGTTPPPAGAPTATTPPATSALDISPPQTIKVTPTGGTFDTTGGATPVRPTVTPPPGTTPKSPNTPNTCLLYTSPSPRD